MPVRAFTTRIFTCIPSTAGPVAATADLVASGLVGRGARGSRCWAPATSRTRRGPRNCGRRWSRRRTDCSSSATIWTARSLAQHWPPSCHGPVRFPTRSPRSRPSTNAATAPGKCNQPVPNTCRISTRMAKFTAATREDRQSRLGRAAHSRAGFPRTWLEITPWRRAEGAYLVPATRVDAVVSPRLGSKSGFDAPSRTATSTWPITCSRWRPDWSSDPEMNWQVSPLGPVSAGQQFRCTFGRPILGRNATLFDTELGFHPTAGRAGSTGRGYVGNRGHVFPRKGNTIWTATASATYGWNRRKPKATQRGCARNAASR